MPRLWKMTVAQYGEMTWYVIINDTKPDIKADPEIEESEEITVTIEEVLPSHINAEGYTIYSMY